MEPIRLHGYKSTLDLKSVIKTKGLIMETSKPPVHILPPKPTFSPSAQWAQSLKSTAIDDTCCLATQRLIHSREVPIDASEYHDILSDLVRLGKIEDLKVVLAHLPPDLTELILTDQAAAKISEGRQNALMMVFDAVLTKSSSPVKSLDLKYFKLNEEEVKHFAGCIKSNESLETLGFSSCRFQKEQATLFHHILVDNGRLKSLRLSRCPSALADFAVAFAKNTTLSHLAIDGMCKELDDGELLCGPFRFNRSLLSLDIQEIVPEPILTKLLASLNGHPKLQRLSLAEEEMNDKKTLTNLLHSLPALTTVVLPHLKLSMEALKAIASLENIHILELLGANIEVTAEGTLELLRAFKARKALTHLAWESAVMGPDCVNDLAEWLKDKDCKLQSLNIGNLLSQPILEAMAFNTSLKELTLRSPDYMAGLDIEGLKNNKTLVSLILSGNSMDEAALDHIAPLLKGHSSISEIQMNYCEIDGDGLQAISKLLAGSPTIRSVYLGGNPYGQDGVVDFLHKLQNNKGLVSVYLLPNEGGKMSLSASESNDVVAGLQKNTSLVRLNHRELFKAGSALGMPPPGMEAQHPTLLSREIDSCLRRNFNPKDPLLAEYLRSFMFGFSQNVIGHADVGNPIWQNFIKSGVFESGAEMMDAMRLRTVMLGTAPYREVRVKELQDMGTGPHDVHSTSSSNDKSRSKK